MLRGRSGARYSSGVATTLLDVFARPLPCACQCHQVLSTEERERSITALFRFDDAMRGWGYEPISRDVGTYGFVGGNALSPVPPGNRPVAHWDRHHHTDVYYRLARRLESEEAGWLTAERSAELVARVGEAEKLGAVKRKAPWPSAAKLATVPPRLPSRNDLCICGSGKKAKKCCAA